MASEEQERRQAELAELKALREERSALKKLIDEKTWHYDKFAPSGEQVGYVEKFFKDAGQWAYEKLTGKEKEPYKYDPYTNPYGLKDGPRNAYNEIGRARYSEEGTTKLKSEMETAQKRIDAIEKVVVENYNLPAAKSVDDVFQMAIAEREHLVERSVPTMAERRAAKLAAQAEAQQQAPEQNQQSHTQAVPPPFEPDQDMPVPQPQAPTNPEPFEPAPPVAAPPPSQDTPAPQPREDTKPTSQQQHVPLIERYDMGGQEDTSQEQAQTREQEDTRAGWETLLHIAAQVKQMEQGIKQMNDDMDSEQEQQGKSGPWKKPLRELYDLEPEPPSPPGPEQDRPR